MGQRGKQLFLRWICLGRRFSASKVHFSPPMASAVRSKAVVLVDLLFYVLSIICGSSVFVLVFVMH